MSRAANGEVIRELRQIINSDERIDQRTALRLQMAATVSIYEMIENIRTEISNNPMIQLGQFIKQHPRVTAFAGAVFLLVANLWFISGFRRGVLEWVGAPDEIIRLLVGP